MSNSREHIKSPAGLGNSESDIFDGCRFYIVEPWCYECRQCLVMCPLCSGVLCGYLLKRFSCFEFDHCHWMGLQCKNATVQCVSERHFSLAPFLYQCVSERHLWTMPCQVSTLQCIVWTFGETGRRGGSTVFTAEWDYSARMQLVPVSATFLLGDFSLPGGLFSTRGDTSREQCLVKCRVHHLAAVCKAIVLHLC